MTSELLKHLNSRSLPSDKYYGFHFPMSNDDVLTVIDGFFHQAFDKNDKARVVALVISKPFDKFSHARLLHKL